MNKCIFMGRLTRDPEIRYTQSEKPVAVINYTLAVDRRYKREGEPSADFINFVAYGAAAEFAEKYFKKGTKLVVVARCQTRTYTNNEGKKVYVTEFIVEDQEFAESKRAAGGEPETEKDGFMQMPEGEELPFNQGGADTEEKKLTAKERRERNFYDAQYMIYYELPVLISKIFHAAFANCECGTPVIEKEDMQFIEGFVKATEDTFNIAMEGQKKQIAEMLKMHE